MENSHPDQPKTEKSESTEKPRERLFRKLVRKPLGFLESLQQRKIQEVSQEGEKNPFKRPFRKLLNKEVKVEPVISGTEHGSKTPVTEESSPATIPVEVRRPRSETSSPLPLEYIPTPVPEISTFIDDSSAAKRETPAEVRIDTDEELNREEVQNTTDRPEPVVSAPTEISGLEPVTAEREATAAQVANEATVKEEAFAEEEGGGSANILIPGERILEKYTIERSGTGPALLAFVGAEYLGRKRDRKLRKQDVKLEQRTEELARVDAHMIAEQLAVADKVRELEKTSQNTAREQAKTVESVAEIVRRKNAEALQHTSLPTEKTSPLYVPKKFQKEQTRAESLNLPKSVEKESPKKASKAPVAVEALLAHSESPPNVLKELGFSKYESTQPTKILEKVESAVEHNIPLEKLYERRHEIKDEASSPLVTLNAPLSASTGLSPDFPPPTMPPLSANPSPSTPLPLVPKTASSSKNLYRQAALGGAGAAVILAAILAVMLIYSK